MTSLNYHIPTDSQLAQAPWMRFAIRLLGTRELPGDQDNSVIVQWIKECAPKRPRLWRDVTPHCSAFANHCMRMAGIDGTQSLAARSWLRWGRRVSIEDARYGDVAVLWRGVRLPGPVGPGHVGFLDHIDGNMVWLVGGNQKNRVGIDPYPLMRVLEIRRRP